MNNLRSTAPISYYWVPARNTVLLLSSLRGKGAYTLTANYRYPS